MKVYEVYHGSVSEGIPVTFKNKPKPHIVIWDDSESCPISITTEGWDEKNLPTKIENVEVIQKSEGYVIMPNLGLITNDNDRILVFWSFTSPEEGGVKIFANNDIEIIGRSSFTYDRRIIDGLLAVLKKGQCLNAEVVNRYSQKANWRLNWNGDDIKGIKVENSEFKGYKDAIGAFRRLF